MARRKLAVADKNIKNPGLKSLARLFAFCTSPTHTVRLIGLVVLMMSFADNFKPGGTNFWKDVIASDGRGYYAYLPSVILHGELDFEQVLQRENEIYPAMMAGTFITEVDGKPVNKYFAGVALLIFPFFMLAWFLSWIVGLPPDGYNAVFQLMVSISGIFYLMLGLHFTWKLLGKFKFPDGTTSLSLWVIVFGTNLLIYTLDAPAMSHVFSFAAVAVFLYCAKNYFETRKVKAVLFAIFASGIIVLIRPVNGIMVFLIPFLAGNSEKFVSGFRHFVKNTNQWLPGILILSLLMLIQPGLWFAQTGHWLVWSYQGEGFDFLHPEILKVLFSYQKGFFIYTPVALLAFFGLAGLYRKSKWQFSWLTGFLIVLTWLVASWWNWYYGDSFGQRVFIDFYAVLALLLAFSVTGFRKRYLRLSLVTLIVLLVFLNLLQSWQYSQGIIHAYAMNKTKYWHVFLKTGDEYRNLFSGPVDIPPFKTDLTTPLVVYSDDFEKEQEGWISSGRTETQYAHGGVFVSMLSQNQPYSSAKLLTGDTLLVGRKDLYAKVGVFIFDKEQNASKTAKLVVSLANLADSAYYQNSCDINEMPYWKSKIWRQVEFGYQLPEIHKSTDKLKIFIWQKGSDTLFVDDFRISIYGHKN